MSRQKNVGQNNCLKLLDPLKNVAKPEYVRKDTIKFNGMQEKIKRRGRNFTIRFRIFCLLFSISEYAQ
jgi:hypothetical protein